MAMGKNPLAEKNLRENAPGVNRRRTSAASYGILRFKISRNDSEFGIKERSYF
jgi:hypothetical protein